MKRIAETEALARQVLNKWLRKSMFKIEKLKCSK